MVGEVVAQGLAARGDGVNITQWRTPDGRYSFQPVPMPAGFEQDRDWRRIGRLALILPALIKAGFVGYVTLDVSAIHDFIAITGTLAQTLTMRDSLQGVEFVLRRQWEEIATPRAGGQRALVKKSLVKIEPAPTWVALQIAIAEQAALGQPAARLQIADGRTIDGATGEIISEAPDFEDDVTEGEFTPVVPTTPAPAAPSQPPAPQAQAGAVPSCPNCGGVMWDNRVGKKNPKAPDFKCRDKGCEGVIWHAEKPKLATKAQIAELGQLIMTAYGTEPAALQQVKVYMQQTFGVDDRAKLTGAQAEQFAATLIDVLNRAAEPAAAAVVQPSMLPAEPPSTNPYDSEVPF